MSLYYNSFKKRSRREEAESFYALLKEQKKFSALHQKLSRRKTFLLFEERENWPQKKYYTFYQELSFRKSFCFLGSVKIQP